MISQWFICVFSIVVNEIPRKISISHCTLSRLVGECEALNLCELKDLALDLLQKYQRTEEQHYVTSFVQVALRDFESWQFEREQVHHSNPHLLAIHKTRFCTPEPAYLI